MNRYKYEWWLDAARQARLRKSYNVAKGLLQFAKRERVYGSLRFEAYKG